MNRVPILSYASSGNSRRIAFRCRLPRISLIASKSRTMTSTVQPRVRDPSTLSNYNEFSIIHTTANFTIDFEKQSLIGHVVLKLKPVTRTGRSEVILDTSYLNIHHVQVNGTPSKWNLLSRSEPYGSALEISLDEAVEDIGSFEIDVSGRSIFPDDPVVDSLNRFSCRLQKIPLPYSG